MDVVLGVLGAPVGPFVGDGYEAVEREAQRKREADLQHRRIAGVGWEDVIEEVLEEIGGSRVLHRSDGGRRNTVDWEGARASEGRGGSGRQSWPHGVAVFAEAGWLDAVSA